MIAASPPYVHEPQPGCQPVRARASEFIHTSLTERLGVIVPRTSAYEGSFPCSPVGARQARCAITAFARGSLSGRDLTDFEGAIGEVLANAVEHSGGSRITVECYVDSGRVIAEIRDYGAGFLPPAAVQAPARGALRGYGLFIVNSLVDEIEYLDNGRRLRLTKRAPDEPG